MSEEENKNEPSQEGLPPEPIPWTQFLEEYPTGTEQYVSGYAKQAAPSGMAICTPSLRLYCRTCDGIRSFDGEFAYGRQAYTEPAESILVYHCRDCVASTRRYYLVSYLSRTELCSGMAVKVGEYPDLDIDVPSSLRKLLDIDYPIFARGLKCEKKGLGLGAYIYYRRVVENQKNQMLGKVLEVAQKLNATAEAKKAIQGAIAETQFDKAMDMVKDVLPPSLLIDGHHNPFRLIHTALSIGIHQETDEICLQMAHSVRMVLMDLAGRIQVALTEHNHVKAAISDIMKFNRDHR